MEVPLLAAVRKQRQAMRWGDKPDVNSIMATCSIPSFGLEAEEVVVSIDPATSDGSRMMLVQSLKNPDLGISVLRLDSDGNKLEGGDESWESGNRPLIVARRKVATPKKSGGQPVRNADGTNSNQSQHSQNLTSSSLFAASSTAAPQPRTPRELSPDSARLDVGAWASPPTDSFHQPIVGGVGRSVSGAVQFTVAEKKQQQQQQQQGGAAITAPPERPDIATEQQQQQQQQGGAAITAPPERPDIATGNIPHISPASLDESIRAAEADSVERLVSASALGEVGDVRQLLARLNPDCVADVGRYQCLTPLMAAVQRGRDEVVQLLLEKRARVDMKDAKGWTALMHATQAQRPKIVSELLGANASVHTAAEDCQTTALMLAAMGARTELCTLLLKAGAPTESRDVSGWKAIHFAVRQGNGGALVSLIAARARVNDQNSEGMSPLSVAATSGRSECVKILLANLADPTARDDE
eukprot:CAMPEP_0172787970 /NCGR_PEP_ID=MMETSP1074-20121228/206708_1 /TAXON_ID=2916 /ORGANISM="Ceratium fusus, Strain PA161109" /LENGTH=469 /DNA_ID=CAMNT_0013624991 /DNA_START=199 /DNA_END=1606 /DNA_ORIENTATION=+